jgi:hypothetical protein
MNHLLYMDDLKLYASNEKQLESLLNVASIFSKDIRGLYEKSCVFRNKNLHIARTRKIPTNSESPIKEERNDV